MTKRFYSQIRGEARYLLLYAMLIYDDFHLFECNFTSKALKHYHSGTKQEFIGVRCCSVHRFWPFYSYSYMVTFTVMHCRKRQSQSTCLTHII